MIQTSNMRSSMARLFRFIKRRPAQRGAQAEATGRSRGGLTTKIVALVDAPGNLVRFLLLPGQAHDMKGVAPLINDVSFDVLLADKAFDADWLLQDLEQRGATAVIPPKSNRKYQRNYDKEVDKCRHLVENDFAKIKEFRGIEHRHIYLNQSRCSNVIIWRDVRGENRFRFSRHRFSHTIRQNRMQLRRMLEPCGYTHCVTMIVH